MLLIEVLH